MWHWKLSAVYRRLEIVPVSRKSRSTMLMTAQHSYASRCRLLCSSLIQSFNHSLASTLCLISIIACYKVVTTGTSVCDGTGVSSLCIENNTVSTRWAAVICLETAHNWVLLVRSRDWKVETLIVVICVRIAALRVAVLISRITIWNCIVDSRLVVAYAATCFIARLAFFEDWKYICLRSRVIAHLEQCCTIICRCRQWERGWQQRQGRE